MSTSAAIDACKGNVVYLVRGVAGLQAYSTVILADELSQALRELGWQCHQVGLQPGQVAYLKPALGWAQAGGWPRWLVEAAMRHVFYPRYCARQIPPGSLVYVVDNADAGVLRALAGRCCVVNINDVASLRPPWDFPHQATVRSSLIWALSRITKRPGLCKANAHTAISRYTQAQISQYLPLDGQQAHLMHLGIGKGFGPQNRTVARQQLGLPEHGLLIMSVGGPIRSKNMQVLAKVLLSWPEADWHWLHIGQLQVEVSATLRAAGLLNRCQQRQGLSNAQMVQAYAAASVFVQPSLYEGFGMPPLEALACGVPVLASNLPVAHEILAEYPSYFDPHNAEALLALLATCEPNPTPDLAAIAHANQFSWQRAAQALVAALRAAE